MPMQMVESGVEKASVGKSQDAEGAVCIEDFRGDSATDKIARQAVIKDIVDIEQTGVSSAPAMYRQTWCQALHIAEVC